VKECELAKADEEEEGIGRVAWGWVDGWRRWRTKSTSRSWGWIGREVAKESSQLI